MGLKVGGVDAGFGGLEGHLEDDVGDGHEHEGRRGDVGVGQEREKGQDRRRSLAIGDPQSERCQH